MSGYLVRYVSEHGAVKYLGVNNLWQGSPNDCLPFLAHGAARAVLGENNSAVGKYTIVEYHAQYMHDPALDQGDVGWLLKHSATAPQYCGVGTNRNGTGRWGLGIQNRKLFLTKQAAVKALGDSAPEYSVVYIVNGVEMEEDTYQRDRLDKLNALVRVNQWLESLGNLPLAPSNKYVLRTSPGFPDSNPWTEGADEFGMEWHTAVPAGKPMDELLITARKRMVNTNPYAFPVELHTVHEGYTTLVRTFTKQELHNYDTTTCDTIQPAAAQQPEAGDSECGQASLRCDDSVDALRYQPDNTELPF